MWVNGTWQDTDVLVVVRRRDGAPLASIVRIDGVDVHVKSLHWQSEGRHLILFAPWPSGPDHRIQPSLDKLTELEAAGLLRREQLPHGRTTVARMVWTGTPAVPQQLLTPTADTTVVDHVWRPEHSLDPNPAVPVNVWDVAAVSLSPRWPRVLVVGHLHATGQHPAPGTRFDAFAGITSGPVRRSGRAPFVLVSVAWTPPIHTDLARSPHPAIPPTEFTWHLRPAEFDPGAGSWVTSRVPLADGDDTATLPPAFRRWARAHGARALPDQPISIFDFQ